MCKLFRRTFPALLAAFFMCALYLAALPSKLTADEINGWQLRLIFSNSDVQAFPLNTDYTEEGIDYTLPEPLIPLRILSEACGANLEFHQTDRYTGVFWASSENSLLFLADLPTVLQLYKEENGDFACRTVNQFEHPRIFCRQFCIPLSYLDCLGLEYEINPVSLQITVYVTPSAPISPDALKAAADAELNRLFTPTRHLLTEVTVYAPNADIDTSQALLLAAGKLHGEVILPNSCLTSTSDNPQAKEAIDLAAQKANLPMTADGRWLNDSIFPLQIACRAKARSLTIRLYQLNSMAVADDYLGQIAE